MKNDSDRESDFTKNKQKTRVSLDMAMNDLGVNNG